MKIFAALMIAGAVCVVFLCASLVAKLISDGAWDDSNGRTAIYALCGKALFAVIVAAHFSWLVWRKKPAASVK